MIWMNLKTRILSGLVLIYALAASAQLAVTVLPVKITGQKAVVSLSLKNNFTNTVQSARAVCFLLDDQGKMIGQSTRWVIGQNKISLEPKAETTFNFVITSPQPITSTNLTAKVSFSRVVLEGGKLADVQREVTVNGTTK
jgi:hypothetical protein